MSQRPAQVRGRRRALTSHEIELWSQVTRLIKPLHENPLLPAKEAPPPQAPTAQAASASPPPVIPESKVVAAAERREPPLARLERRVKQRLARGLTSVDDAIDLHGMRQDEAHAALRRFLFRAQAGGARVVLVVTGKGKPAGEWPADDRGVLRRNVPHWLRSSDLRHVVLAFEEASHRHGGAGALYVRLRANRV
ncbi:MAG: Smr protein/MutS2 [Hyphomicrobiales bacterium]|nr:Smr protein/MutS2 [Hyphomicrobiales bacterium]